MKRLTVLAMILLIVLAISVPGCAAKKYITHTESTMDGKRNYVCYFETSEKTSHVKVCNLQPDNTFKCVNQPEADNVINSR